MFCMTVDLGFFASATEEQESEQVKPMDQDEVLIQETANDALDDQETDAPYYKDLKEGELGQLLQKHWASKVVYTPTLVSNIYQKFLLGTGFNLSTISLLEYSEYLAKVLDSHLGACTPFSKRFRGPYC